MYFYMFCVVLLLERMTRNFFSLISLRDMLVQKIIDNQAHGNNQHIGVYVSCIQPVM
jgi:hypothetical protein